MYFFTVQPEIWGSIEYFFQALNAVLITNFKFILKDLELIAG
jgi:hypothetical protein